MARHDFDEDRDGDYAGLESVGPYRIIQSIAGAEPQRLVFDTNVAIDVERFYFGSGSVDRLALKELLDRYPAAPNYRGLGVTKWDLQAEVDINYGWAVGEATFLRTGEHDAATARQMLHALGAVLRWDPKRLAREFANRHPPVNHDKGWPHFGLPIEDQLHHPGSVVAASYGALLYLCHLDATRAKWRGRCVDAVFADYYSWLSDELGIRGAYEIAAGIDFLAGSRKRKDRVRSMLKLGGGENADQLAAKAWNAAWDLQFLRAADGMTFGFWHAGDSKVNTALVTRNIDPWLIRTQSRIRMVFDGKPYLLTEWDEGTKLTPTLEALLEPDFLTDLQRGQQDPAIRARNVYRAVHALEEKIGVTSPTRLPVQDAS